MSFKQAGEFLCTVVEAEVTYPKFPFPQKNDPPNGLNHRGQPISVSFDICLKCQAESGEFDYCFCEISNRTGMGNFKDRERWEQTLDTLQQIGFNVQSMPKLLEQFVAQGEVTTIPNLIGVKCIAVIEETPSADGQKTWRNLKYIKGANSGKPQGMSLAQINQMFGMAPAPAQQSAPAQQQGFQQQGFQQQAAPAQQQGFHPQQQTAPAQQQQQQTAGGVRNPYM